MNLFETEVWFQSFGSGSSGNCYFVGNQQYGILIDAGLTARTVRKHLRSLELDMQNIRAIFVTHDHTDHIKGVAGLGEHFLIPVFATAEIHRGIAQNWHVTQPLDRCKCFLQKEKTVEIEDFKITPFHVSHDATDSVGYKVEFCGKTLTFATDLGEVGKEAEKHLKSADYIILEANYDEEMLRAGRYPKILQSRIHSKTGHLSNRQTGNFLAENWNQKWKKIFLCHLSKENNTPDKALDTVFSCLKKNEKFMQKEIEIVALERTSPSKLYIL